MLFQNHPATVFAYLCTPPLASNGAVFAYVITLGRGGHTYCVSGPVLRDPGQRSLMDALLGYPCH